MEEVSGKFSYQVEGRSHVAGLKKGRFAGKTGYFSGMVQNAVDFLDGRAALGSSLADGIATLRILEEMKDLVLKSR